jgi:hypothetical protein
MRLFIAVALLWGLPALAGFAASPMRIERAVSPDDNILEFVLSNTTDEDLQVGLRTAPVKQNRAGWPVEGTKDYPYDISSLIHLDQTSLTLKARKWKRVRARVDVPSRPGGGYAFIYARVEPSAKPGQTVVSTLQLGIVVELTFPEVGKAAIAVEDLLADKNGLRVAVSNQGNVHSKPQGKVEMLNVSGARVWSSTLVPANVFPLSTRELLLSEKPPAFAPGKYAVRVTLEGSDATSFERNVASVDGQLLIERPRKPKAK